MKSSEWGGAPDVCVCVCASWLCSFYANACRLSQSIVSACVCVMIFVISFSSHSSWCSERSVQMRVFVYFIIQSAICCPEVLVHCKHHHLIIPKTNITTVITINHVYTTRAIKFVCVDCFVSLLGAIHCANFSTCKNLVPTHASVQIQCCGMCSGNWVVVWDWFNE